MKPKIKTALIMSTLCLGVIGLCLLALWLIDPVMLANLKWFLIAILVLFVGGIIFVGTKFAISKAKEKENK